MVLLVIIGGPQEHEIDLQDSNGIVMPMSVCMPVCAGVHTQVHMCTKVLDWRAGRRSQRKKYIYFPKSSGLLRISKIENLSKLLTSRFMGFSFSNDHRP